MNSDAQNKPTDDRAGSANLHEVLDVEQAAKYLKVHPVTVRRLAANNVLPARKIGRGWRFHREALKQYLYGDQLQRQQPQQAEQQPRMPSRLADYSAAHLLPRRSDKNLIPDILRSQRAKGRGRGKNAPQSAAVE